MLKFAFILVVGLGHVSSQPCAEDFSVVYQNGAQPVFTVNPNGTCTCAGSFAGNGSRITGLDQNPAVASHVATLNARIANQSATIAAQAAAITAMQAQIVAYQATSCQSATIAALQSQLNAINNSIVRNGLSASTAAASCKDLMGLTGSGFKYIQTATGPQSVWCDMSTDGGGWTQVYKSGTSDLASSNIGYAPGMGGAGWSPVANSAYMMFAFTDASNNVVTSVSSPWKFPTPQQFHGSSPMQVQQCAYIPITTTRIADGAVYTKVLRAGWGSFGSVCDDNCASTWGQICLKAAPAAGSGGFLDFPAFHSFAVSQSADHCVRSDQSYTAVACSASSQFTIYVR